MLGGLGLIVLPCIAGCDGSLRVRGFVHDRSGAAISNAHVLLEHRQLPSFKKATDSAGCFSLWGVVPTGEFNYTLRVEAAGYETLVTEVSTRDREPLSISLALKGDLSQGRSEKLPNIPCLH